MLRYGFPMTSQRSDVLFRAMAYILLLFPASTLSQNEIDDVILLDTCPTECACDIRSTIHHRRFMMTDCANRNLLAVPENISQYVQAVSIRGNAIGSNDFSLLQPLSKLFELDLSFNNVTSLQQLSILPLWPSLMHLDLSNNILEVIDRGVFGRMPSLELLLLSNNQISVLKANCLENLARLKRLSLSGNRLTQLDVDAFATLPSLLTLQLDGNTIDAIPPQFFTSMTQLENISLSFNRLELFEDVPFSDLARLRRVDLSHNFVGSSIKATRVFASSCETLATIILDGNSLSRIESGDFVNFSALRDVSLSNLPQLVAIDEGAFRDLPVLDILRLHSNPQLCYIHPAAFDNLPLLRILYLHSNNLMAIPADLVRPLASLEALSIGQNPLHCDCNARWIRERLVDTVSDRPVTDASDKHIDKSGSALEVDINALDMTNINAGITKRIYAYELISSSSLDRQPIAESYVSRHSPSVNDLHLDDKNNVMHPLRVTKSDVISTDGFPSGISRTGLSGGFPVGLMLLDVESTKCDGPNTKIPLQDVPLTNFTAMECQPSVLPLFNGSVLRAVGESITLNCRAIGVPTPAVHWILPSSKLVNGTPNSSRMRYDQGGTLTLNDLKTTDYGTYTCVALNARGYDVANTQLRLYASTARVLLKAVSATFVAITWNGTDATMMSANYVITYQPSSLPSVLSLAMGSRFQANVNSDEYGKVHLRPYMRGFTATNLHPRTEYDFCLSSEHVDGTLVHLHCLRVVTKYSVMTSSSTLSLSPLLTAFDVAIATLGLAVLMLLFSVFGVVFKRYARRSAYEQPRGFNAYGQPNSSTTSIAVEVTEVRDNASSTVEHGSTMFGGSAGQNNSKALGVRRLASMSQIPLRNLYEPPSTPLSTSRTSLLGPYPV